jgi:hypothetical protein
MSRRSRSRVSLRWQAGATEKMMLEQEGNPVTSQLLHQAD